MLLVADLWAMRREYGYMLVYAMLLVLANNSKEVHFNNYFGNEEDKMIVKYLKGNVIGEYFDKAFDNNRVFSFELDISKTCNADCLFCFQGEKRRYNRKEMKISDYDCFLSDCKKLGGYYIGISGGEPFCNPEAINIIRTAQRKGYRVGIITNGQLINDAILEELIDLNLSRISFSFHGFRKDTYAKHFGVDEKKYDYVLNIIQKLINAECRVGIAYTVTKYNITEFSETKKMFMDMGLKEQDIKFNMLLRGNVDVSDLYPSKAQLADVISQNKEYFRELEKNQSFGLCCAAGRCSFSVNAYGDVYPCTFFNSIR